MKNTFRLTQEQIDVGNAFEKEGQGLFEIKEINGSFYLRRKTKGIK